MSVLSVVRRVVLLLALPVLLVTAWWVVMADSTDYFWPPLSQILGTFDDTWFNARFTTDVLPGLARLLTGYLLALVVGVSLGVVFQIVESRVLSWYTGLRRSQREG